MNCSALPFRGVFWVASRPRRERLVRAAALHRPYRKFRCLSVREMLTRHRVRRNNFRCRLTRDSTAIARRGTISATNTTPRRISPSTPRRDIEPQIHLVEVRVKRNREASANSRCQEPECHEARRMSSAKRIEFRPLRDIRASNAGATS